MLAANLSADKEKMFCRCPVSSNFWEKFQLLGIYYLLNVDLAHATCQFTLNALVYTLDVGHFLFLIT